MAETITLTVTQDQMPLDLLLFRHFKREIPGLVERVYDLNQGLADKGVFLPVGERVVVEIPEDRARKPTRITRLY